MGMISNLLMFVLIISLFFESVDGSLCGESAVIWIGSVGDNLVDIVGACNVVCVGF